jgi:hypothetical protein
MPHVPKITIYIYIYTHTHTHTQISTVTGKEGAALICYDNQHSKQNRPPVNTEPGNLVG